MKFFFVLGFVIALFVSVTFRTVITNPFKFIFYSFKDIYEYFVYKKYNICPSGELIAFTGLFGKGKTLSAVYWVVKKYLRYNDKQVWDKERGKFVTQKIHLVSNVELVGVPFEKFVSLAQFVQIPERMKKHDYENDTQTVTLILGDEFSVQMNSRSFKTNIDPLVLNTILTCRHHRISLVYTAQRFHHVDALLRQVTMYVYECKKLWRVMRWSKFDAWDLENANSTQMVKPMRFIGWFVRNKNYNAYDTLACVENLVKSCKEGDMLTEEEILALLSNTPSDMDAVNNVSRKWKRRYQKRSLI